MAEASRTTSVIQGRVGPAIGDQFFRKYSGLRSGAAEQILRVPDGLVVGLDLQPIGVWNEYNFVTRVKSLAKPQVRGDSQSSGGVDPAWYEPGSWSSVAIVPVVSPKWGDTWILPHCLVVVNDIATWGESRDVGHHSWSLCLEAASCGRELDHE